MLYLGDPSVWACMETVEAMSMMSHYQLLIQMTDLFTQKGKFGNICELPRKPCRWMWKEVINKQDFQSNLSPPINFFFCVYVKLSSLFGYVPFFLCIIHKKTKKPKPWNWTNFRRYWAGQKKYSSIWFPRFFRLVDSPNCSLFFFTPLSFSTNIGNFYSYMLYIVTHKA